MKKHVAVILQAGVVLIGISALALMLWFPHIEGRNAHATFFEVYFKDPFLAYAYLSSVAFFVALYQVFKLLGYAARNAVFSQQSLAALRTIKYCALCLIGCIAGAEMYFFVVQRSKDDIAGGVMMGLCMIVISAAAIVAATRFEKALQRTGKLGKP